MINMRIAVDNNNNNNPTDSKSNDGAEYIGEDFAVDAETVRDGVNHISPAN